MASAWSDRDAAVVPWIRLKSAADGTAHAGGTASVMRADASAPASASAATHAHSPPIHSTIRRPANRHPGPAYANSCKLLSLLGARERVGSKGQRGRSGWLSEGVAVTDEGLARAGAWNPRRLQNMTLAVGPGTPASCVVSTSGTSTSSSEEDSSDSDAEMFQEVDSDGEDDGDEESDQMEAMPNSDDDEKNEAGSESNDDESTEMLGDAEEGQEYHFDDSGRLVRADATDEGSVAAREEAEAEIARQLGARITQSPGGDHDEDDPEEEEKDAQEEQEQELPRASRRSRWVRRQQHILPALTGASNRESDAGNNAGDEDMEDGEGNAATADANDDGASRHSDDSDDSGESAGLRARDRYNLRQVERYIDHIESLHRRRERRENRQYQNMSSPARDRGVFNKATGFFEREVARSMKHGGCINTVSWLDCGWRISTVSHEDANPYDWYCNEGFVSSSASYSSNNCNPLDSPTRKRRDRGGLVAPLEPTECPTQLLTSGDDHLVKFWDVSQSMGSTSPLPGGSATITPFSSPRMPMRACSELVDAWKNHGGGHSAIDGSHRRYLPGIVHPLVTLSSGHRGNVFHAAPVPHHIGKVATCAADGYLRLSDVEVQSAASPTSGRNRSNSVASASSNTGDSSQIVINPEYANEDGEEPGFRFRTSPMCFSFHFLNTNVGLVCSERGLLHFDLRLPANAQKRGSLIPELGRTCKACFPWRMGSLEGGDSEVESAYVFAGGSDSDVALYDLRMAGPSSGESSQVVKKFRPRALRHKSSSVAVSGIDLSKDKRELLVSYESDHVYTFPIFPDASAAGPTLADIDGDEKKSNKPVPELAAYGGHLNRLTFLKSAKYAGPNDEYICTGSDSGHAWIYEKSSGTVLSFMKADNSTCNGIQPHPSLPFFITYGIDSTAKLWRATTPVDDVDDSDLGRFNYSQNVRYEKSVVVDAWKKARRGKEIDLDDEELAFFPDETSEDDNDDPDSFLGVFIRSRFTQEVPFIGNDLMNLTSNLSRNYFTCARSVGMGDDEPVKSGIAGMKRRVSLIKLRYQADRLGLAFNSQTPWILAPKEHLKHLSAGGNGGGAGGMLSYGCLADLIPDSPSDWVPFEKLLANPARSGGMRFNTKYTRYHLETSTDQSVTPVDRAQLVESDESNVDKQKSGDMLLIDSLDNQASKQPHSMQSNEKLEQLQEEHRYKPSQAWDILFQTVSLLKEAGNEALKASLPCLAARRYDKAINYCSLAYLQYPAGTNDFLVEHMFAVSKNGGYECRWNELLKTLLMIRLNLALCYLKEDLDDAKGAAAQANFALKELQPFASAKGVVLTGKKLTKQRTDEPHETYTEAKALQAKAYFRLGSAQLALDEYDDAVKAFEQCLDSTTEGGLSVDAGVMRKINEAKRCRKEKKESQRKKFKFAFGGDSKDNKDNEGDEGGMGAS
ncbi:hypothetical protein ACHAXT_009008 [Thalassiosira profunda]